LVVVESHGSIPHEAIIVDLLAPVALNIGTVRQMSLIHVFASVGSKFIRLIGRIKRLVELLVLVGRLLLPLLPKQMSLGQYVLIVGHF